jgi:hypothetical protein
LGFGILNLQIERMYTVIIGKTSIQLNVKNSEEVTEPMYAGYYKSLKYDIETQYNQYGRLIGPNYSVDELEFALRSLELKSIVSSDVARVQSYENSGANELYY